MAIHRCGSGLKFATEVGHLAFPPNKLRSRSLISMHILFHFFFLLFCLFSGPRLGTKGLISYLFGRLTQRDQDALKRERDISVATYVEFRAQRRPAIAAPPPHSTKRSSQNPHSRPQNRPQQQKQGAQQGSSSSQVVDIGHAPNRNAVDQQMGSSSAYGNLVQEKQNRRPAREVPHGSVQSGPDRDTLMQKIDYVRKVTGQSMLQAQFLLLQAQGDPRLAIDIFSTAGQAADGNALDSRPQSALEEADRFQGQFSVQNSGYVPQLAMSDDVDHHSELARGGAMQEGRHTGFQILGDSPPRQLGRQPDRYNPAAYDSAPSIESGGIAGEVLPSAELGSFDQNGALLPADPMLGHQPRQAFGQRSAHEAASSNRFASGAHQNSGNVLTDRPSTRVQAPPGGKAPLSVR